MNKLFIFLLVFLLSISTNAQIITPVKWEYRVKKVSASEFELQALALIDKPWHLYGQYFEDGGPVRLTFHFIETANYELIRKTLESPKPKIERDEIFNIDVQYFSDKALFTQKVKITKATDIKVVIEGQACNDNTGMCVMVSGNHTFSLK
ncbi:MAG: hypothetical protein K8R54_13240 [Bacteroidales bacterium]|nr:hypothetical protein [Bacteroidales bacterium]